jgi:hypothetical protein
MFTKHNADKYADFVDHPRYGRRPKVTGLNLDTKYGGDTFIHWHSPKDCRIPNTAIPADLSRQTPATVAVTHYFDVTRQCRDCGRSFIFFAEEQKHWYEELGFGLDSDCVRCVPCRKRQQGVARTRERYEDLFHIPNRTTDENLEMADCCLSLIESGTFTRRQLDRVRMLLNAVTGDDGDTSAARYSELLGRVRSIEARDDEQLRPRKSAAGPVSDDTSSPPAP